MCWCARRTAVAKLADLMLAKALDGPMAQSITRAGEIVGELPYMSPEQTTGITDLDCRSDIYNLGATCYRLLTGHTPAEGKNAAETIRKIQNEGRPIPRSTSSRSRLCSREW